VGTYTTWEVTYTVGELGIDDGGTVKVAGNMSSDWGRPQFEDPTAENYATVETSGDARVEGRWDPDGYERPLKGTVSIDVFDGALGQGETVTLTLGATGDGSIGHQVQTFPEEDFELVVLVDAFESGEPVRLPEPLTIDVVPGAGATLHAFVPTHAEPGESVDVRLRVEDFWGNTATGYEGTLEVEGDALDAAATTTASDGIATVAVTPAEAGVHRLSVQDPDRPSLSATTNPMRCGLDDDRETYWGDIHGQSGETVGTGTVEEYFTYLRENAHLDFGSHVANDFQITDAFWETIQEQVRATHEPGSFVTFLGYEWSPNTPNGGDHNVYFRGDEATIHRSSHWQIAEGQEKHRGTNTIDALYDTYAGRDDVVIVPHQGGRPARGEAIDPELTPFVEIASVWGIFEWFGQEALERGHPVGFVGGSDDHTGRPGASRPTNATDWSFPIDGPVMAASADGLDRDALWEAFQDRRVYATTGGRIYLDVQAGGVPMGEEGTTEGSVSVEATVNATAPIQRVDLVRGSTLVASRSFEEGRDELEVAWRGARSRDRHKVQDWSGALSLSEGRIAATRTVGFDHPTQGVEEQTDTTLEWSGATAGNEQALRLDVEAPPEATLRVATKPVTATVHLDELEERQVFDAGAEGRELSVRRAGRSTTRDATVTFEDEPASDGRHAYYVRVRQEDGEVAWSSPVFLDVA
jgi:hypothetical protein